MKAHESASVWLKDLPPCYSVEFRSIRGVYIMLTMQGRNAVVFGVANKRSIAWAIAQRLSEAGARLAITYQNERLKREAHDLITALPGAEAFQCDVSQDCEIEKLYVELKERYGRVDVLVHSVAYALAED